MRKLRYRLSCFDTQSQDFNNRSKYENTAINNDVLFFSHQTLRQFSREIIKILVQNVVARRQISGQKCGRRSLKRGGGLIQWQIIVKIVWRVSKWSFKTGGRSIRVVVSTILTVLIIRKFQMFYHGTFQTLWNFLVFSWNISALSKELCRSFKGFPEVLRIFFFLEKLILVYNIIFYSCRLILGVS